MRKIEITEYNNLLVYDKTYSVDFIRETIESKSLNGLSIFDHMDPLRSLEFLNQCAFLRALRISCIDDQDYSFLKKLTNLEWLSFGISVNTKNKIDLSHQTKLKELNINWRKNIYGIEICEKLEKIGLIDFKEKNLKFIEKLPSLRELVIKTASLNNLAGIEFLGNLEFLHLGNCRRLISIKNINGLKGLKEITLDGCPKVQDYDQLFDLPSIGELTILGDKEISSLKFITNLSSLKRFKMLGKISVTDGDLSPLLNLQEVFYVNKKHYNIKFPPANYSRFD